MAKRWTTWGIVAAMVALGTALGSFLWKDGKSAPQPAPPAISDTQEPTRGPGEPAADRLPPRTPAPAQDAAVIPADETSLMAKLHQLGENQPQVSLELARAGNQRFPESPGAPERGWIVVKSLVNMQRFEEARAEAVSMVAQYPNTPWARDVERHLLVNPLTHPSERGYSGADPVPP